MSFLSLLNLPTSESKQIPNIHLLIRNKQMVVTPMWTNLTFLTYYVTNDYFYASNLHISTFTILIIYKFYNVRC